ncbi:MAG: chemotaxis protein CheX [Campylobacterales bacterium]|nr:chemotaxis protein CheX [Campylobacterales bacterium]
MSIPYNDTILSPLAERTKSFLKEDMGIEILEETKEIEVPNKFSLKDYTVTIGIGGSLSVLFIVSYEKSALDSLLKAFAYDDIEPEEEDEMKESVASEIANTVIGNSLPNFPKGGDGVTITPPIVICEAKSINKQKDSNISISTIKTSGGEIVVGVIGPRKLFEEELHINGGDVRC